MKNKLKGFTLVELVITIAIVIILSVISVPIYRGYVDKAKYAEGYALLGVILSAQKAYYSQYGNFLSRFQSDVKSYSCFEGVLGVDARGNKYFTYFRTAANETFSEALTFFNAAVYKPQELVNDKTLLTLYYNITEGATIVENNHF